MLDNGKWSSTNEKIVVSVRDMLVKDMFSRGMNVIVDDTNLAPVHEQRLRNIVSEWNHKAASISAFEVKDFTDVPIEVCIKRDLMRLESVGEAVIRKMYKDFLAPQPYEREIDPNLPWAVLCDMDGTLALFGDKNPYKRDFENDVVNEPVKDIVNLAKERNRIIIFSGREDQYQEITEKWLRNNDVHYDEIHMRETEDVRKDDTIKEEMYRKYIQGKYNVFFVLDDRNRVVDLWRRLGLTCLQVAPGDF